MVPLNASCLKGEPYNFTTAQYRVHLTIVWTVITINCILLALTILNFCNIIIKQQKWKTVPFFVFYILSFVAISLRLIYEIDYTQ